MSLSEIQDYVSGAKFNFELMAIMLLAGRTEEASKSYKEGFEYLCKILEDLEHRIEKSIGDNS